MVLPTNHTNLHEFRIDQCATNHQPRILMNTDLTPVQPLQRFGLTNHRKHGSFADACDFVHLVFFVGKILHVKQLHGIRDHSCDSWAKICMSTHYEIRVVILAHERHENILGNTGGYLAHESHESRLDQCGTRSSTTDGH